MSFRDTYPSNQKRSSSSSIGGGGSLKYIAICIGTVVFIGYIKFIVFSELGEPTNWDHEIEHKPPMGLTSISPDKKFVPPVPLPHKKKTGYYPHSQVLNPIEYTEGNAFANSHSSLPFEPAVDCPPKPSKDYPKVYPIMDMLDNWNTDSTVIPEKHFDSLCHFDYTNETQVQYAYAYRAAERPFVVYNIPEVDEVTQKWVSTDYLKQRLGNEKYRAERSKSNHFMYWRHASNSWLQTSEAKGWQEPTQVISTRFEDWLNLATTEHNESLVDREHQYFRVSSDGKNAWLFDELPFFQPKKSLFLVEPRQQRGIHCRFGMRSIIAEAHFDGGRNAVVQLGGLRRWILAHPNQCEHMHMLKGSHPSSRHTAVDWSKPDVEKYQNFPKVRANEVILQPGDYLFVPTYWLHTITSINVNYQCNSRSGLSPIFDGDLKKCGFKM